MRHPTLGITGLTVNEHSDDGRFACIIGAYEPRTEDAGTQKFAVEISMSSDDYDVETRTIPLIADLLKRVARHVGVVSVIIFEANDSTAKGWAEATARISYKDGGGFTLGAIQRDETRQYEFHS